MGNRKPYPREVRERAVRMVLEHGHEYESQWAAISSIAEKFGMTAETLRKWVRQAEVDDGRRPGITTAEAERVKELERENRGAAPGQRDPQGGVGFLCAGARPAPTEELMAFIDEHRDRFGVEPICRALQIAPSTYWAHIKRRAGPGRPGRSATSGCWLRSVASTSRAGACMARGRCGGSCKREGVTAPRCAVERLMRREGLQGVVRGRRRRTTVRDDHAQRPADLVDRDFTAAEPNRLWVADFTYVMTWSGVVYVAFVIDVFSRRIVGWKADTSMKTPAGARHARDGALGSPTRRDPAR